MSDDAPAAGGFIEQTVYLPQKLWARVERLAEESAKEPSEILADGVRLLLSGATPAAPSSIGMAQRQVTDDAAEDPAEVLQADDAASIENRLAGAYEAAADSPEVRDRLMQVMRTLEQRESFIDMHAEAVSAMAIKLAGHLDIEGEELRHVELAAISHDLGKLRVPETVLGKQGRLTGDEWKLTKRYPEFGAEMLSRFDHLQPVADLVRAHQERWDGSGYPDGVEGDDLPVGAQIIGLCDVYHVLTAERSYRPALSPDIARRTIEAGIGRLWNPKIAELFLAKVASQ